MSDLKLWYTSPAEGWSQGLPAGSGRMGAVIMAAPQREVWSMNEVTFWSGREEAIPGPFGGREALEEMRRCFLSGKYAEGDRLAKQHLQPVKRNFGTNLALCELEFSFDLPVEGLEEDGLRFRRELDLETAVIRSECHYPGGYTLFREAIASHADDVIAARVWSGQPGGVSFTLGAGGGTDSFTVSRLDENTLQFRCQATEQVHSDGTCGVWAEGRIRLELTGGKLTGEDGGWTVEGADEARVYFTVCTDYPNQAAGWEQQCARSLEQAAAKGYAALREAHILDYRGEFAKISIRLGEATDPGIPTDSRIRRLAEGGGTGDPGLFALFLQYGRYLMVAGSRADSPLPLHLQGIWNDGEACRMGWSCDYHLDINTQMNYYPAEAVNLGASHLPLMRYLERLAQAGRRSAQDFYGSEGWTAHVFSNVWGFTAPGWETSWGLNVTGGLWLAVQMIEHYEYSLDHEFLQRQAYPVLKEAAAFFLSYMTVHPDKGWLVSGPSNSPENSFYPDSSGEPQQLSMGVTLDQVLIRELFTFCLRSAELLGQDEELQARLIGAIAQLPPLMTGSRGQLQEWLEDYGEAQPEHRHLSHLSALYPASQITPEETPDLSAAARITLENRMQQDDLEDVEFTAALFALYFARLHDGERAYKHIAHLISGLCLDNLLTYSKAGIAGAESNIFVIDGNFGGTAAIAELLLQSRPGEIRLLPALPAAWGSGSVSGLRAKGNIEADIEWADGQLVRAVLRTHSTGTVSVRVQEQLTVIYAKAGSSYTLDGRLQQM